MQNFMKIILSAVQTWTKGKIKESTADWNQNDSSKDSYVKNRTHWEEEKRTTLVNNLTFSDYDSGNAPKCNFVPGQKYDVIWNGVLYEGLVCWFDGEYNAIASLNNGYPFYIDDDGGDGLYIEADDDNWTVSIIESNTVVHKLDSKYLNLPTNLATTDDVQEAIDVANAAQTTANTAQTTANTAQTTADSKMDATNPTGTGSFSMNRKSGTTVGINSHAEGYNTTASGNHSHAEGYNTTASDYYSHAEGYNTTASGSSSHAEGSGTTASGYYSHAEGYNTIASRRSQNVIGEYNISETPAADNYYVYVNNDITTSVKSKDVTVYYGTDYSFDESTGTFIFLNGGSTSVKKLNDMYNYISYDRNVLTTGAATIYELVSTAPGETSTKLYTYMITGRSYGFKKDKYAHIVGNGESDTARSNAHTLDWEGNAWYQGDVYVGSTSGTNKDDGSKKLATEEYVDNAIAAIESSGSSGSATSTNGLELVDKTTGTHYNVYIDNGQLTMEVV